MSRSALTGVVTRRNAHESTHARSLFVLVLMLVEAASREGLGWSVARAGSSPTGACAAPSVEGGFGPDVPRARFRWRSCRHASACRQVSDHQPRSPRRYAKPSGDTNPSREIDQPRHSGRSAPKSPRRNSRSSLTADHGTRRTPASHARTVRTLQPNNSAQVCRLNRQPRRSSRKPSGERCHARRGRLCRPWPKETAPALAVAA